MPIFSVLLAADGYQIAKTILENPNQLTELRLNFKDFVKSDLSGIVLNLSP